MRQKLFAAFVLALMLSNLDVRAQKQNDQPRIKETPAQPEAVDDGTERYRAAKRAFGRDNYQFGRAEQIALWRGLPDAKPTSRNEAIYSMMRQENALKAQRAAAPFAAPQVAWTPIGPAPIPNGQTQFRTDPVSGRVSSIAVHPTNPNIVYVGAAQGGVYRTLDGGATWTPLLDNALSLAIGAIAISPSSPSTVFVGTGEAGFSADSFFGVGVYRITNADTNPVVAGPLNLGTSGADVFTGRSISEIIVHPTNPNTIFVSSTRGTCGLGGCTGQPSPATGIFRSTNALDASPTFAKLNVTAANGGNRDVMDMVIEPDNANNLICWVVGNAGAGDAGVYRSTNALDGNPTFTQTYIGVTSGARGELALQKTGATVSVVAATGDPGTVSATQGKVIKSVDGGATFAQNLPAYDGFCNPQCFYDIAVAFDPTNGNNLYVGGSPAVAFSYSLTGGATMIESETGLHVDTHAIAVAPSNPSVIYFGSDGGVWRSADAGLNWTSRNTATLNSIQFQSIALHPTDRFFTIGGTQDNGTQFLSPSNTWARATGGDGGQSVIDQNATTTTTVSAYHTFFNQAGTQIGYQRISTFNAGGTTQPGTFRGCTGSGTAFGINCTDAVLFYAPLSRGPGNPNTLYLGTNKLYRSANRGDNHDIVSQTFGVRLSAVGISPQNDNVRIVGMTNGGVFATTTGATTLTDVSAGQIPARYVARAMIDPNNQNTAYVTLTSYGLPLGQHVWKTTNLNAATPTWTASGSGIPDVPVNAFTIDPANSNNLFAGTDIGVYRSVDGGASWTPFNEGLPRVAVFDMAIQPLHRILKIVTHGRGAWEMPLSPVVAVRSRSDFDGDGRSDHAVFRNGNWFVLKSTGGFQGVQWGAAGDQIAPGDYDGDNKDDFVVFRPTDNPLAADFFFVQSQNGFRGAGWGGTGDISIQGDFDGDKRADATVYRASNNTFYVLPTANAAPFSVTVNATGTPVVLDYDGDGTTDFAIYTPATGIWTIRKSNGGAIETVQFGAAGDKLVPADYDNDNRDDIAVYRDGNWFIRRTANGQVLSVPFGIASDIPVPGDYDGDGADDIAVYRDGTWFVSRSTGGVETVGFGAPGDKPVPAGYLP